MMNLLPPEPPRETEELNGTFKYLKSKSDQIMFSTAYKAITMTETWDYIKNMETIFGPESNRIYNKIEELGYLGHSGCSFMCTLREKQLIARHGEKNFKDRYDDYEKRTSTNQEIQERRRIMENLQSEMEL
jgi:hypothetical protein